MKKSASELRSLVDTVALYQAELEKYLEVDDGKKGKAAEVALRYYLTPRTKISGIAKSNSFFGDARLRSFDGKNLKVEIKSACGELGESFDSILVKSDYVAYCLEIEEGIPLEQQFRMLPTADFVRICQGEHYSGKSILREKISTQGFNKISFQSFFSSTRLKASRKLRSYLESELFQFPTVQEWVQSK